MEHQRKRKVAEKDEEGRPKSKRIRKDGPECVLAEAIEKVKIKIGDTECGQAQPEQSHAKTREIKENLSECGPAETNDIVPDGHNKNECGKSKRLEHGKVKTKIKGCEKSQQEGVVPECGQAKSRKTGNELVQEKTIKFEYLPGKRKVVQNSIRKIKTRNQKNECGLAQLKLYNCKDWQSKHNQDDAGEVQSVAVTKQDKTEKNKTAQGERVKKSECEPDGLSKNYKNGLRAECSSDGISQNDSKHEKVVLKRVESEMSNTECGISSRGGGWKTKLECGPELLIQNGSECGEVVTRSIVGELGGVVYGWDGLCRVDQGGPIEMETECGTDGLSRCDGAEYGKRGRNKRKMLQQPSIQIRKKRRKDENESKTIAKEIIIEIFEGDIFQGLFQKKKEEKFGKERRKIKTGASNSTDRVETEDAILEEKLKLNDPKLKIMPKSKRKYTKRGSSSGNLKITAFFKTLQTSTKLDSCLGADQNQAELNTQLEAVGGVLLTTQEVGVGTEVSSRVRILSCDEVELPDYGGQMK